MDSIAIIKCSLKELSERVVESCAHRDHHGYVDPLSVYSVCGYPDPYI
jgi:hypothetical protein